MDNREPGVISSILSSQFYRYPVRTSSNIRQDKTKELGTPRFQLFLSPGEDDRNIIMERLFDNNQTFSATLVIDKTILDDDELMAAIRSKAAAQGKPSLIRIADQGYTLTREDYQKLSFVSEIAVDKVVDDLLMENNILIQSGAFKIGKHDDIQPTLERRNTFEELIPRNIFHVNHQLSDEEFQYLVDCVNQTEDVSIELDYFNPDYYEEFLQRLQEYHVKENINIQLIGYLLEDNIDTFTRLEKYPYEIDVVYSTCHDMVDMYTQEPYTENRLYYSQVEGGGKTSLGNYLNVLEELSNFEVMARNGNYSPLEIAILAKIKIDSDYIYDPDYQNANTDYWDNVNLSQMIHHQENGQRRAICVGFATLYSAYCRRCGIPMFRYSTRDHMRTIGRIQDDKYGVDAIGTADITWDLPDQNGYTHSYQYFMGSPRDFTKVRDLTGRHEFLTVADVFALPMEDFESHLQESRDPVESFYTPIEYNPMGYAARLLELMNVAPETEMFDLYDIIYNLCARGCFEGIPEETLYSAISNVLHSLNWSEERISSYLQEVRENQQYKQTTFGNPPAIGTAYGFTNHPVNVITPDNVQSFRNQLWQSGVPRPVYLHTPVIPENENGQEQQPEITPTVSNPVITPTEQQPEITPTIPNPVITPTEQQPEITPTVPNPVMPPTEPQQTIDTEDLDYVHQVIAYCVSSNTSVYDYYHNIGNMYHGDAYEQVPAFEATNPFLNDRDISLVATAEEEMIVHYFANTMMKVILLNLTPEEARQFESLFTRDSENYVDSVIDEMNQKISDKEEKGKEGKIENTPDPTLEEETNPDFHPEDYTDELIPGTNIHKPRERGIYESDEEYVDFLRDFYRRHFPNAEYVQAVLDYCRENQINIYDYYYQVGSILQRRLFDGLPEFELDNPFLSEGDLELLQTSDDDMILTYFANTMMKTIGLNISDFKRDQLADMFPDEIENYTVAIEEQYHR